MLRIGLTGHRPNNLPSGWQRSLADGLKQVFERLAMLAKTQQRLVLSTGLAAGADSAGASAMMQLGGKVTAVLAFHRAEFAKDFAEGEEREVFLQLLSKVDHVEELPGTRADAPAAYAAIGDRVLDLSDVLVAVWDGAAGRGRGGTRDVIDQALLRGLPVVHVPTDGRFAEAQLLTGQIDLIYCRFTDCTPSQFQSLMSQNED